jgi:glutathione S-transferase
MKLYNADLSPNCLRVRAVANELGIDLELIHVDLRKGEHKADEFLEMNPNAKVPVLVDGDFRLWESRAINGYLAALKPKKGLYPDDPKKRAIVDQWLYWQTVHLGPAMQKVSFERFLKGVFGMGEPDKNAAAAEMKQVDQFLRVLDEALAGRDWVAGDLSLADFALATTFMYREPAAISLADFPNVAAWIKRLESRDSWQKAAAPQMALARAA